MRRLVHSLALGAAFVAVAVAVWRDYGAVTTLKRAAVAYIATFSLVGGLGFVLAVALRAYHEPPPPEPEPEPRRRSRRKQLDRASQHAKESEAISEAPPDQKTQNEKDLATVKSNQ